MSGGGVYAAAGVRIPCGRPDPDLITISDTGVLKTHDMKFDEAQEAFEMYRLRQDGVIKIAMSF